MISFPRCDTKEHAAYDKRTPGMFKEEWSDDGCVTLCSKTYFCFEKKDKFSCKGLNKRQSIPLTAQTYLDVLKKKASASGINRGFQLKGTKMITYSHTKEALSYLYIKRKVADDGITTLPLDL